MGPIPVNREDLGVVDEAIDAATALRALGKMVGHSAHTIFLSMATRRCGRYSGRRVMTR
jgi:hypothetical protein